MPEYCISCEIDRGAFSDERTYEFPTPDGGLFVGLCCSEHLMDTTFQKLRPNDVRLRGYVKCRVLKATETRALVDVPQGDVLTILRSQLTEVPA